MDKPQSDFSYKLMAFQFNLRDLIRPRGNLSKKWVSSRGIVCWTLVADQVVISCPTVPPVCLIEVST